MSTKLSRIIGRGMGGAIFCYIFVHLFVGGWLPAFLILIGMLLPVWDTATGLRKAFHAVAIFGVFLGWSVTLPVYRVQEMLACQDSLVEYAQQYYQIHREYPPKVPIPLIWDGGDMTAIAYYGDSIDASILFFFRRCCYLKDGTVQIVYLD